MHIVLFELFYKIIMELMARVIFVEWNQEKVLLRVF